MGYIFIQNIPDYINNGLITSGPQNENLGLLQLSIDSLELPPTKKDSAKAKIIDSIVSNTVGQMLDTSSNQSISQVTLDSIIDNYHCKG